MRVFCPSEFLEKIWAKFFARLTARNAREMVEMFSPFIGNEHGIFTCSILFPHEWDIQVGSWPKTRTKWDKKVKTLYSNIENGMWMDVSIRWMDISIQNGCARSDRMDVFVWGQPVGRMDVSVWRMDVSVRHDCTRSNWIDVSVQNDCTHSNRANVSTLKGFLWILIYKGQNFTRKWITQKTQNNNNHKNKWVQWNFIEFLSEFDLNSDLWSVFIFYFRSCTGQLWFDYMWFCKVLYLGRPASIILYLPS